MKSRFKALLTAATAATIGAVGLASAPAPAEAAITCNRTLTADIVAFDMPLMFNRLGAQNVNGMMFALRRDTVDKTNFVPIGNGGVAGDVTLRPDKRPRPLVLRMGAGDCLTITLTNLLDPLVNPRAAPDPNFPIPVAGEVRSRIPFNLNIDDQVADRRISLRFQGTQLVTSIGEDGSFVGQNASSLLAPTQSATYTIYAPEENAYVGTSYGTTVGGEGLGGNTANGLWAVLNVGPRDSAFYRSQMTREEMDLASAMYGTTALGQPIVDYEATYPMGEPWASEGKADLPIINMVTPGGEIVHSDINAIVAYGPSLELGDGGGGLGHFPPSTYPLESVGKRNPTVPNRLEPFREFTIAFHDEVTTRQAYPRWFEDPVLGHTLHGVRDSFMINYGSGGIGTEIISSRLGVGPMHDCVNCAYEEFFLTAYTVGDVGMLTDIPANFGLEECTPALANCGATGPKANFALFPDDPSNVHHSYTGDFTKFRNVHAGPGEQHIFHLHNHQWLFNANDDNSNYLDAQGLGPGSGYTYEINFGGSGNRNRSSGDAIFHCHFYPHFAQGMWEMWRHHDVLEQGTAMEASVAGGGVHQSFADDLGDGFGLGIGDGTPAAGARALPDGEVLAGTPIPGVVPLPGKPMPQMPAAGVTVKNNTNEVCVGPAPVYGLAAKVDGICPVGTAARNTGSLAEVPRVYDEEFGLKNPGYPFWVASIEHSVGQRPTSPPLDMMTASRAQELQDEPGTLWDHPGMANTAAVQGWDGGLPRWSADGYSAGSEAIVSVLEARLDLSKEFTKLKPFFYPEEGTDIEQAVMAYHAKRNHPTYISDEFGTTASSFVLNGLKPVPGAPYHEPCGDDNGVLLDGAVGNFFDGDGGKSILGSSPFNATTPRVYKAANVQFDAVFNKLGYHYPQQRIITLWQDVVPTIDKTRPPEPFVLRMNTFDCTQYVHSNVVPKAYELDDYQVRTPTDIIGQHIHLPKWDLTTTDGAANGWNYEDGTLSPGAVVEIIHAINAYVADSGDNSVLKFPDKTGYYGADVWDSSGRNVSAEGSLLEADHPYFGTTPYALEWKGARSTIQRWFADPVVNVQGIDRGLGIIFTHDHYGPSTHQQIGLYATVLIEPAGSEWLHNETGVPLYSRTGPNPADDGGPTSWQAAILTGNDSSIYSQYYDGVGAGEVEGHREFYFEYSDFQHAYQDGVYVGAGPDGLPLGEYHFADSGITVGAPGQTANANLMASQIGLAPNPNSFRDAIMPSFRLQASLVNGFPVDIWEFPPFCPGDIGAGGTANVPRPCPEAITADDPGMYVVNYRNESLAARVFDPNRNDCPDGKTGCQTKFQEGDLAYAMDTNVTRAIPELNDKLGLAPPGYAGGMCTGVFCPPISNLDALAGGDPFTPTMRVVDGDRVHIKMQAGGQEEEHTFMVHGLKWLQGGSGFGEAKNSGWRNAQPGGISEQFALRMPVRVVDNQAGNRVDYAYTANNGLEGWTSGTWGIMRSTRDAPETQLVALPGNDFNLADKAVIADKNRWHGICPDGAGGITASIRNYDVTAVLAEDVLPAAPGVIVQDLFPGAHEGRSPQGPGTLVYNSRPDAVAAGEAFGGAGPLHDPTAILWVNTDDLVAYGDVDEDGVYDTNGQNPETWDNRCLRFEKKVKGDPSLPTCPVKLKSSTPVEPLVIRANAGECVEVQVRNKLLQQAQYDDGNGNLCAVFNDTDKPVFEDTGPAKYKGGHADCDGDGTYDYPNLAYVDVIFDGMPDLASGNAQLGMVRRDPGAGIVGMTTFNNNLMAPSPFVGLHAALVEYDVTKHDGTNVGRNPGQLVGPGEQRQVRWYAGDVVPVLNIVPGKGKNKPDQREWTLNPTPIEFGGFNIMPADKIKQGQKGLIAAGAIYPEGSTWTVDAGTTTEATVTTPDDGSFRDFTTVAQKGASMSYADSFPVENILGEGTFGVAEDSQDMGHMTLNYGTEPLWFRFGKNPTVAGGNAGCLTDCLGAVANAGDAFSNALVGGQDPQTAVFDALPGEPFRQHVLMPFGPGRGSTFDLHGHVWQRDPYVCPNDADLGLPGKCDMGNGHAGRSSTGSVGSQNLGDNPIGFSIGGIESWYPGEHYEVVIPSAGGDAGVAGDYLFRDHMGLGNAQGLWGIVRVQPTQ